MQQQRNKSSQRLGILIINLGTPDAPTPKAVRNFLAEFLADPNVVKLPKLLWLPILHEIVLPIRSKKSAQLYQKIWMAEGSPLAVYSQKLVENIRMPRVALAMRYGNPSIFSALKNFQEQNISEILVLPLFPQYSSTTTKSVFDAVFKALKSLHYSPQIKLLQDYYDNAAYISAITNSIKNYWASHGQPDHLLFSFHGIPKSYARKDPYAEQCHATAKLVAERLAITNYSVAFQSRFGFNKWLQPSTQDMLEKLPKNSCKSLHVICPGFPVDCLETLEEINIRGREQFLAAGGKEFHYIPALNSDKSHVDLMLTIISSFKKTLS